MLILNKNYNYHFKELYYYNLMEQDKISIDELKNTLSTDNFNEDYFHFSKNAKDNKYFMNSENLSELKDSCLYYINAMCNAYIQMGIDVKLSDGIIRHFTLTLEDQQNIITAYSNAKEKNSNVPYHADEELCKMFSLEEITNIYNAMVLHITYQNTYCNMLKHYINNDCNTNESVIDIFYSMDLPEEYDNKLNDIITQSANIVKEQEG